MFVLHIFGQVLVDGETVKSSQLFHDELSLSELKVSICINTYAYMYRYCVMIACIQYMYEWQLLTLSHNILTVYMYAVLCE